MPSHSSKAHLFLLTDFLLSLSLSFSLLYSLPLTHFFSLSGKKQRVREEESEREKKIDKEEEMEKMKRNGSDGKKSKRYILHDIQKNRGEKERMKEIHRERERK